MAKPKDWCNVCGEVVEWIHTKGCKPGVDVCTCTVCGNKRLSRNSLWVRISDSVRYTADFTSKKEKLE